MLLAIFKFKIFTVAGSMLVSIGAYALFWGWQFAVGFVLLLLVHELGHVLEAKRQGLPVSAPMFIPFLGALITLKRLPDNAWNEAKVAIAGPILGGLGAAAVWGVGEYFDSELLVALAFTGFFLNLFNLAPISPLDGGRIVAAIHPALWIVGLLGLLGLTIVAPNPILILILVLGGLESWRRWQHRRNPEGEAYYRVSPSHRCDHRRLVHRPGRAAHARDERHVRRARHLGADRWPTSATAASSSGRTTTWRTTSP